MRTFMKEESQSFLLYFAKVCCIYSFNCMACRILESPGLQFPAIKATEK